MNRFLKNIDAKEWLFQLLFLTIIFLMYAFDKEGSQLELYKFAFFFHYSFWAFIISYVCLPQFFYKKKYWHFFIALSLVLCSVYILEELVFEQIFFEKTRARKVTKLFYTLLDFTPIIITMVSFKLAWDSNKAQRKVDQLQSLVKDSELRFLKSQINPHFLFNNLNNLYSYAIENSPKTPSIILELSSVLRYMLYDCREDYVPLKKEIDHLKHYCALNELQIEERGSVSFSTNIVSDQYVIAPLILVVFIENAFKHSTASQSKDIDIAIDISVSEEGKLIFSSKNSFLATSNKQNLSNGIGLNNVRKRLEFIYPDHHTLTITEVNGIYDVLLTLQLKSKS